MSPASNWCAMRENDREARSQWFRQCKAKSIPLVEVLLGRKHATLSWDCITVDAERDSAVRGLGSHAICRLLFSLFQDRVKTGFGKPIFEGSAFVGTIENLEPSEARALADQFFTVLNNAMQIEESQPA